MITFHCSPVRNLASDNANEASLSNICLSTREGVGEKGGEREGGRGAAGGRGGV